VIVVSIVLGLFALTMLFNTISIFLYGEDDADDEGGAEENA